MKVKNYRFICCGIYAILILSMVAFFFIDKPYVLKYYISEDYSNKDKFIEFPNDKGVLYIDSQKNAFLKVFDIPKSYCYISTQFFKKSFIPFSKIKIELDFPKNTNNSSLPALLLQNEFYNVFGKIEMPQYNNSYVFTMGNSPTKKIRLIFRKIEQSNSNEILLPSKIKVSYTPIPLAVYGIVWTILTLLVLAFCFWQHIKNLSIYSNRYLNLPQENTFRSINKNILAFSFILFLPFLIILINKNAFFQEDGWIDPWIYTNFFYVFNNIENLSILKTIFLTRTPWIFSGYLSFKFFSPVMAQYILHISYFYILVLALYFYFRYFSSRVTSLIFVLLIVLNPTIFYSLSHNYVNGASLVYTVLCLLLIETTIRTEKYKNLFIVLFAVMFTILVQNHISNLEYIPFFAVYYLLRNKFDIKTYLKDLIFVLTGTAIGLIIVGFINKIFGLPFCTIKMNLESLFSMTSSYVHKESLSIYECIPIISSTAIGIISLILICCRLPGIISKKKMEVADIIIILCIMQFIFFYLLEKKGLPTLTHFYYSYNLIFTAFIALFFISAKYLDKVNYLYKSAIIIFSLFCLLAVLAIPCLSFSAMINLLKIDGIPPFYICVPLIIFSIILMLLFKKGILFALVIISMSITFSSDIKIKSPDVMDLRKHFKAVFYAMDFFSSNMDLAEYYIYGDYYRTITSWHNSSISIFRDFNTFCLRKFSLLNFEYPSFKSLKYGEQYENIKTVNHIFLLTFSEYEISKAKKILEDNNFPLEPSVISTRVDDVMPYYIAIFSRKKSKEYVSDEKQISLSVDNAGKDIFVNIYTKTNPDSVLFNKNKVLFFQPTCKEDHIATSPIRKPENVKDVYLEIWAEYPEWVADKEKAVINVQNESYNVIDKLPVTDNKTVLSFNASWLRLCVQKDYDGQKVALPDNIKYRFFQNVYPKKDYNK